MPETWEPPLPKGLLASGQYTSQQIIMTEKRESRISYLRNQGFQVTENNQEAVSGAEIIVMSVKPQQFIHLAEEISQLPHAGPDTGIYCHRGYP